MIMLTIITTVKKHSKLASSCIQGMMIIISTMISIHFKIYLFNRTQFGKATCVNFFF